MKRSEILGSIVTWLEQTQYIDLPTAAGSDFEAAAKELLLKLEEEGMQPPAVKEPCETFVLHQGKYIKTEDSFMFTHKWDQE